MPTLFEMMPLLEGWDYHGYTIPATLVTKGVPRILLRIDKPGWVMAAVMACTDAYATLLVKMSGPGGMEHTGFVQPEAMLNVGAVQADPQGYLQMYNRPLPASTAGYYYVSIMSPGIQGEPFPFKDPIMVEGYLGALSTQNSAFLSGIAFLVEIKDMKTFKNSLVDYYEMINRKQLDATAELTAAIKALTAKLK